MVRTSFRGLVASALLASTLISFAYPVSAAPTKKPIPTLAQIAAAKAAEDAKAKEASLAAAKLQSAKDTLNQLTAKANRAVKNYQSALFQLGLANQRLHVANVKLAQARKNVSVATVTIGKLAQKAYEMGGGNLTTLSTVLNSNGPQDLLDQLAAVKSISDSDKATLEKFKVSRKIATDAQAQADKAKQDQMAITIVVNKNKVLAQKAQAAQAKEVNRLSAIQQQIINELAKDRSYRLTLEQQRAALLLEEQNSNIAPTIPNQAKVWPSKSFMLVGRSSVRSNANIVAAALEYAKTQVLARKPYVWGGAGPNNFDCSGLVYAAYHAAGLNYPNWSRLTAALYYGYTMRVPLNALQPGDVLFYSFNGSINSIHHITIYAGNNMMWEANSTKAGLKFSNIFSIPGLMPYGGRI